MSTLVSYNFSNLPIKTDNKEFLRLSDLELSLGTSNSRPYDPQLHTRCAPPLSARGGLRLLNLVQR